MVSTPLLGATEAELRRDRTSVKWVAYPPDVLPLWVAEMDVDPVPGRRRCRDGRGAARRHRLRVGPALRRGGRRATPHERWGWEIDTSAAMIVPDVMIGAAELLRLLTDEGGPVVVSPPVYDSFFGFVDAIGRRRRRRAARPRRVGSTPRRCARRFRAATAGGERAAYLLCNPQNPTGTVHSRAELASLAALAEEHGVRVVADEIHAPRRATPGAPGSRRTSPCRAPSAASRCSRPRRGGTSPG